MIIAVDGPAASGKGTIARALARHYGLPHMDTGLLYRAAALNLLRMGLEPESEFAAARACDIDQIDLGDPDLRSEAAGSVASRISAFPLVRQALIERQRHFAALPGGAVLDGRDIGTVIAPNAQAKLFVTATDEVRARRRWEELRAAGLDARLEDVLADIRARDQRDSARSAAPLRPAEDAERIDTSTLPVEAAIAAAIAAVERRRPSA
ncbi:(d)CMP kinase [Allosphingosinicella sp.]|jgi:cytidylate kinase|uniref:(d)CMP kinase n=1 Tax=Allosphingosinicella sp. TaxID=2823234 RepID=UPI002EE33869